MTQTLGDSASGHHALAPLFAAAMERLGPFEARPALAVAVSGGADSMALAVLASDWVGQRGGTILALVVDHGLRSSSAEEARQTLERLAQLRIPAQLLPLSDLAHGPALAERARIMRYDILAHACRSRGILHLLLGHHAADQTETLAMRVLRGSGTHGLAGMAALREIEGLRLLRPLLDVPPESLRRLLEARGIGWVEDPSNRDPRATRSRLRLRLAAHRTAGAGSSASDAGLAQAMGAAARLRADEETRSAVALAKRSILRPEGFALLAPGRIACSALGELIATISGASYAPSESQIGNLARQPGPATVAGVRIMPAGRLGDGWLIVREEAAIMAPVRAAEGAVWDNRFRIVTSRNFPADAMIGKLGQDATRLRRNSDLPAAVLRTLPAVRIGKSLVAVPHLGYFDLAHDARVAVLFSPRRPAAGPCFVSLN